MKIDGRPRHPVALLAALLFSNSFLNNDILFLYSCYLLHPPLVLEVILAINNFFFSCCLSGGALFILAVLFSVPVATFTYRAIEYPFLPQQSR